MRNIYHKIYIHPLFYLVAFIFIFTGHFKAFVTIMSILLFHELGHVLTALFFKWKIDKIVILPLGCLTKFNEKLNRPIYQEFIILIMGPIFQVILYIFYRTPYHYSLLILNLLPIYPLDGSKFIFLFCNIVFSYYNSYTITFIASYISIFLLLFYYHNFIILIFSIFLLFSSIEMLKLRYCYFCQFIYERYLKVYPYYKNKLIYGKKYKKMMRSVKHFFVINHKLYEESVCLKETFNLKNKK